MTGTRTLRKLARAALPAMALYAAGVHSETPAADAASDSGRSMFSLSGFGTLGLVHSSERKADFTSSIFKPGGAGHSRNWSADVDSRIAGQLTATLTPQLVAVVQVIAEQRYDNTYIPAVEWANISYQLTPDLSARAGRVVMPDFLASGYRKVGYAYTWVRPPLEVYGLVPITKNDGVDASYRLHFGGVTNTIQGLYGGLESTSRDGTKTRARNQWGIFNTAEYGLWTWRIAYHQTHLTLESLRPFFDAFRRFGPQGFAIADKYDCNGKLTQFATLGASYDPGQWFLTGEWAKARSHCFIGARTSWYASGGYRIGKLTPYLTYARTEADSNTSDPGLTVSALPPFLAGPAGGLNAGLNGILGSISVQQTVSAGGRWDFAKNAALKLQFDHTRAGAGSPGVLTNTQPGFQPGGSFNLFSATLDFVF